MPHQTPTGPAAPGLPPLEGGAGRETALADGQWRVASEGERAGTVVQMPHSVSKLLSDAVDQAPAIADALREFVRRSDGA